MTGALLLAVYLLVLVGFLGHDVLGKISPTTRPALLAGAGAVAGTVLIAAIVLPADGGSATGELLRTAAAALATAALVGGFVAAWRQLAAREREGARTERR